eukprot:5147265-Pyramimonas_sp.AAC.1
MDHVDNALRRWVPASLRARRCETDANYDDGSRTLQGDARGRPQRSSGDALPCRDGCCPLAALGPS